MKTRITITIDNDLYEKMKAEAKSHNRSLSNVIETNLKNYYFINPVYAQEMQKNLAKT
jgi:hypothetical protein